MFAAQYEAQGKVSDSLMVSSLLMLIYITKFFWTEAAFWCSMEIAHDRGTFSSFSNQSIMKEQSNPFHFIP